MSKKIGCGGFRIDDDTLKLKEDGTLYAAGGGGVQSDWNQNDSTALDYIKNRPFYAEPIDGVIFSNDSVAFSRGRANLGEGELSIDSIYTVTFDGTVYDNLVPFYSGVITIGSPYNAMSDAMPFCISGHDGSLFIVTISPGETHSITIYEKGPGIHTIDASYTNIYENGALPFEITWDGNTAGLDSFTAYNKTYYKVSSTYPEYSNVIGCRSMLSDDQMSFEKWNDSYSKSCYILGHAIVALVKTPDELYLPKGARAKAPSTGIYFEKNDAEGTYQSSLTMYLPGDRTRLPIRSPFGKEFSIMVDEDGKLYTKEVMS